MEKIKNRVLTVRLTDEEYRELQSTANYLCDGNLSHLVRNYILTTQGDYRLLRRLGIVQTVMFFRNLSPEWKRYRGQTHGQE